MYVLKQLCGSITRHGAVFQFVDIIASVVRMLKLYYFHDGSCILGTKAWESTF